MDTKNHPIERNEKLLSGKRIGIFGKGGSGKSTLTVLLAEILCSLGYKICILDADSTNIGLNDALGIENSPAPMMNYFGGMIFSGGLVTCPVDDPTPIPGNKILLENLPKKYYSQNKLGITLLTAGKIGALGPGAGCDGPVSKIARDLQIYKQEEPLLTLIDFKAGFEDTARGAITGLDWAIVVVDPTFAAIELAVNMRDTVEQIKKGKLPATHHLEDPALVVIANQIYKDTRIREALIVLNKVSEKDVERQLRVKLDKKGIRPIGIIHDYPGITYSWLNGAQLAIPEAHDEILKIVNELEAAEGAYIQAKAAVKTAHDHTENPILS
jgi:CO dehydrogenase nickel-insertion accessory protein CooC1